jgi:Domain of unknown function (DUF5979)
MQVLISIVITLITLGMVPDDAQFEVEVACDNTDPASDSVQFGPEGGTDQIDLSVTGAPVECTVTEPENGGASAVEIDPETFTLEEPEPDEVVEVIVRNTFAGVPPPPGPAPVDVEPTFTG